LVKLRSIGKERNLCAKPRQPNQRQIPSFEYLKWDREAKREKEGGMWKREMEEEKDV
jgi:hypothetical protein